jgi:hypothetical protein
LANEFPTTGYGLAISYEKNKSSVDCKINNLIIVGTADMIIPPAEGRKDTWDMACSDNGRRKQIHASISGTIQQSCKYFFRSRLTE